MSKGEDKIVQILNKYQIYYKREKTFSDLKHGKLRFDFYIIYNNQPIIIEFNGQQHYQYSKFFHKSQVNWRKAQEYDRRKISYCLANNIPIYIIPYWEYDNLTSFCDLINPKFRAKNRWKNDYDKQLLPQNDK